MRPHVTLINPPYPVGSHLHPPFLPLGIGYLAAVLEKNNYEVDVIDCQALRLTYDDVKRELTKRQPNVVGLTSTTLTYKSALRIVQIAKEVCPDCLTVLGGVHVTFWDEKALQESPYLDVVVRKEGENTFLELMQRLQDDKSYHDIVGTTCRKDGTIVKNPDRPYIEDLDSLPFPAHHLWPMDSLRKYGTVIFPVMTSRGCTFWCDFCSAVRMFGRRYRMRTPKNVVDELEFLHKTFGAEHFTFYDDAFTVDQSRTEKLCKEIVKRKMKIKWNCETRVDMVTKKLLLKMRAAGCTDVWFGVESGSQRVINAMGKGIYIDQTVEVFNWAREIGLMTVANVILGVPDETRESAWETIKFVERLHPDDVGYYIATPYPGTPMYNTVKEKGWLKITDFDKYDTATPIFETPKLRMDELREIREQAFQRFYLRPSYIVRMIANGGVYGAATKRLVFAHFIRALKSKL